MFLSVLFVVILLLFYSFVVAASLLLVLICLIICICCCFQYIVLLLLLFVGIAIVIDVAVIDIMILYMFELLSCLKCAQGTKDVKMAFVAETLEALRLWR